MQLYIFIYYDTDGHRHIEIYADVHFNTLGCKTIYCLKLKTVSMHYIREFKSVHIHSKTCGSPKWCTLTENEGFTQAEQKTF